MERNNLIRNITVTAFFLFISFINHSQYAIGAEPEVKTVKIGNQVWMLENLNTSTFRNGDPIPEAKTNEEWIRAGKENRPAWCYYENNNNLGVRYGKLYNWYAVSDPRGIAPLGWHVPTDSEWAILENYIASNPGNSSNVAQALAAKTEWASVTEFGAVGYDLARNNSSGFTALPVGFRGGNGSFNSVSRYSYWWSSSEYNGTSNAWYRGLGCSSSSINRGYGGGKGYGYSVRCVRISDKAKPKDIVIEKPTSSLYNTLNVKDIDGNVYHTVTIGNQVWMVENLRTTKLNDGTNIPFDEWQDLTPSYGWFNDDVDSKNTYGALYNWHTVNTGKLAPKGWHVPTNDEWTTLTTFLGGENIAGGKLKERANLHWLSPNAGATNENGFTALPGGYRGTNRLKYSGSGYWWSSSENDTDRAWCRVLGFEYNYIRRSISSKDEGFSVRCVKDNNGSIVHGDNRIDIENSDKVKLENSKNKIDITSLRNIEIEKPTSSLQETHLKDIAIEKQVPDINKTPMVKDIDGNVYHTVTIGTQVWMVENLKTTKYNDGTNIPNETDQLTWKNLSTPSYCWYDNDVANKSTYGALYNWYAVNTGKLAPKGWHVPTDSEWATLITVLGGENVAGSKLKKTSSNTGVNNEADFSAIPGGSRDYVGRFSHIGQYGEWWSSTVSDGGKSWNRHLNFDGGNQGRYASYNEVGFSVRCIQD